MYIVIVIVIIIYKKYPKINKILNVWGGPIRVEKHVFLKKEREKKLNSLLNVFLKMIFLYV